MENLNSFKGKVDYRITEKTIVKYRTDRPGMPNNMRLIMGGELVMEPSIVNGTIAKSITKKPFQAGSGIKR
jgi:hypothetical protein